jgi:hypothetical protein
LRRPLKRKGPVTRNFNEKLISGTEIELKNYDLAHLWGPGFGDEALDGIMYAPAEVNRIWQNRGAEDFLRRLQRQARAQGGTIELTAQAVSHPRLTWRGHEILKEVSYSFDIRHADGSRELIAQINLHIPPPNAFGEFVGKVIPEVRAGPVIKRIFSEN